MATLTNVSADRLPSYTLRNRFINGDFRIDQRNVGVQSSVASGSVVYGADRWRIVPTGNNVGYQRVSSSSGWNMTLIGNTSVTQCFLGQYLEGNNILDMIGNTITLSAKISSTTLTSVTWLNQYATSALDNWTTYANSSNGVFTINSTPTVYTTSFTPVAGCGNGMSILFGTGTFSSGNIVLTDVQLELGSVSSPFERRWINTELPLAQRYFAKSYSQTTAPGSALGSIGSGSIWMEGSAYSANSIGYLGAPVKFPVTMRAPPGITIYDNAGTASRVTVYTTSWANGYTNVAAQAINDCGCGIQAGLVAGMVVFSCDYTANAEIV